MVTIYTTVFGGLVLAGGKAADMLGARRVLLAGLALFVLASAGSALAQDGTALLVGRACQGVGAALLSPAALAVLLASVPQPARARALAVWGSLSAVGAALGVTLGGVITSSVGWPWIFAINVPVGLAIAALLPLVTLPVPASRDGRPDLLGAGLVTIGTALVVLGLVNAGDVDGSGWSAAAPLAAGILSWLAFAAVERRVARPMLRPALLRERPVVAGVLLMTVATGLMVGNFFLGSFALQRAHGEDPLSVGLAFLPVAGAVALGAHLGGRIIGHTSARVLGCAGLGVAAAGEVAAAVLGQAPAGLVAGLAIAALGIGTVFVTAFSVALGTAGPGDGGLRSAIVSTAHELGGAFGVAVLSTVAAAAMTAARPEPASFSPAFWVAGVIAVVAVPLVAVLAAVGTRPARPRATERVP